MELFGDVAASYRDFAAYADGDSPCFAEWARGVAEDPEVLAWVGGLATPREQQPNLVFAAARWHGLAAPAPYAALRQVLLGDGGPPAGGAVRATIASRATQTNEVGRLATLVPALAMVAAAQGGEPLALLEVGASAGLCLFPDRWDYTWVTGQGDSSVEVSTDGGALGRVRCEVAGDPPLPSRPPPVSWRGGLDLNPLDVTDADTTDWLATLVWPEQHDRLAQLRIACEVARRDPPDLVRADLTADEDVVADAVSRAAEHGHVVVFHSAVTAYLPPEDRARFESAMRGLVDEGRCHWLANEGKGVHPSITATGPAVPEDLATFVMGLDGQALAWTHGHGRSMTWVGPRAPTVS